MLVLGIHVATANSVSLGIDKVKLNHTCDIAIFLLFVSRSAAILRSQFEEHTRGKRHLVMTRSGITLTAVRVGCLPVVIALAVGIVRVGGARIGHQHIAGEVAQIVHHAVDAEIVAVYVSRRCRDLLKRQLTHTVDGKVSLVLHLSHTVTCSLKHHAASNHANEVGTLQSVEQSACVNRAYSGFFPVLSYLLQISRRCRQFLIFVLIYFFAHAVSLICYAVAVGASREIFQTLVAQTEVCTLTVGEFIVLFSRYLRLQVIVVGAVVRDMQLTIAVNKRQVAATVESAHMLGADGDEVAARHVAQSRRHVAEHGSGVGIHLIRTVRHVAAAEYRIMDNDTPVINVKGIPLSTVTDIVLALEGIELLKRHIVILGVCRAANGHAAGSIHLSVWLYNHLTVFCKCSVFRAVNGVITTSGSRACLFSALGTDTIYIAEVAAAEYVAVAVSIVGRGSHLAATDIDLCLSEHVAVGIEGASPAEVVVTLATCKDIALHMAVIHLDVGLAQLVFSPQRAHAVLVAAHGDVTTAYGCNLATAEETVTDHAVPHGDASGIHTTVVNVAAAEDVAAAIDSLNSLIKT